LTLSASAGSAFLGGIVSSLRCPAADTPYEGCTWLELTTSLNYLRDGGIAEVSGSDVLAYTAAPGGTSGQPAVAAAVGTAVLLPVSRAGDLRVLRYTELFSGPVAVPR
jgi:hypothetical protein